MRPALHEARITVRPFDKLSALSVIEGRSTSAVAYCFGVSTVAVEAFMNHAD